MDKQNPSHSVSSQHLHLNYHNELMLLFLFPSIYFQGVVRVDHGEPSFSGYIFITVPASMAQGTPQKMRWKDCKSQNIKKSALKQSLIETLLNSFPLFEILSDQPHSYAFYWYLYVCVLRICVFIFCMYIGTCVLYVHVCKDTRGEY